MPLHRLASAPPMISCCGNRRPKPLLAACALIGLVACGGAPSPAPEVGPCSPRSWDFETADGVVLEPSTTLLSPVAGAALAPPFEGQRQQALAIPVRFGPEDYYMSLAMPVCQPTSSSSFLRKKFSVRYFLEGPALPEATVFAVSVWPQLEGTTVPLELRRAGLWVTYAGRTPPPIPPSATKVFEEPTEIAMSFAYTSDSFWQGTIWIDELRIAP